MPISDSGITILDPTMRRDDIRILKRGLEEVLGIKVTNETGEHLFIEVRPNLWNPIEIIIRK